MNVGTQTQIISCQELIPSSAEPRQSMTKKVGPELQTPAPTEPTKSHRVRVRVSEKGSQIGPDVFHRGTQSVTRLTRGRACQTEKEIPTRKVPSLAECAPNEQTQVKSQTHCKNLKSNVLTSSQANTNEKMCETPNDTCPAVENLLALAERDEIEDCAQIRPWTPAEDAVRMELGTRTQGTKSSALQVQVSSSEKGSTSFSTKPSADPGVLFGGALNQSDAPVQTRLLR